MKTQQTVLMNQQNAFQNNLQNMLSGFFQNQASTSGTLPSNTIPNPKGEMKAITTRSGVAYEGPSIPTNPSPKKVVERETEETTDKEQTNFQGSTAHIQPPVNPIPIPEPDVPKTLPKPNIPYPSRRNDQKFREKASNQMEKIFQIFQDLRFDISFTDALLLMPRFAPTIKNLLMNKEKLFELAKIPLNENCSAMLLKKLPEKLGDPGNCPLKRAKFEVSMKLPSVWHVVATNDSRQPGLMSFDFDDLYNNLKVYEHELKGVSINSPNIAFSVHRSQGKIRDLKLEEKQKELDQALKERDDFKVKLEKWTNASVLQNEVLNKQRYVSDKSCIGFGIEEKAYKAVPPPTGTIIPPRANVSFTGIDELAIRNKVVNQEKTKSSQPEIDRNKVIIEDWVDSDDEETDVSESQKETAFNSENSETSFGKQVTKQSKQCWSTNLGQRTLGTKGMDNRRPRISSYSPSSRSSNPRTTYRPQRPKKIVKSIWVKKGSTVGSQAVLPQTISVKKSAMITSKQTWRQKGNYLDSVNRDNGSYTLKQFEATRRRLKDYAIIDSGWLWEHNVLFTDKECLILSPKFKFVDEDLVILRAPRKNDVYSLDLKNIIPSEDNYSLPSQTFKIDHSCLACNKGKQHRASCKKVKERTIREPLELLHMDLFGPVSVESINKKKYCLVVTDDCSKFSWVFFLAYKDETYDMLHDFDCGKESRENIALQGLLSKMVLQKERIGLSLKLARTMLADSLLPIQFWAEAFNTACYENQKGKGPDWMFDLDLLTPSMNYIPVRKENYANSGDKVSTLGDVEDLDDQQFIVHTAQPMHPEERTAAKEVPLSSEEQALHDELMNLMHQESLVKAHNDDQRIAFEEEKRRTSIAKGKEHVNSTFTLSTANTPPQSAGNTPTDSDDDIPKDGVFSTNSFDDENTDTEEGGAADYNKMDPTIDVTSTPTLRIHKIHPQSQIIGKSTAGVQTRRKLKESTSDQHQALLSFIYKQNRTNHKDQQTCLFACFLSQEEPKKVSQALADESWVEAMQEELLQFKLQDVWVLCDLPEGKRGTDKRNGEVVDYEECVCNSARIEAIHSILALHPSWLYGLSEDVQKVYVDDIIFGSTKSSMVKDFEELMQKEFKMSSMGELTFFLGLQVKQSNAGKDEEGEEVDVHLYRSMIGCLMYLTASRPDIMFAVCLCARFQVTPKVSHLHAVKRIFRYLKHQPNLGLWYPKDSPFHLEAFLDSDYAGDNHDRRSTSGGCQYLGRRLVSWQCKKQTIVAISSTEAEYVAAASCCAQVLWMQNQLLDYGFNFMNTEIHIDNESTICIVRNPVLHSKTKHIQIRHHFIRDCYEQRLINVVKVHTDDNVADLLTKGFDLARFNFLVVGLHPLSPYVRGSQTLQIGGNCTKVLILGLQVLQGMLKVPPYSTVLLKLVISMLKKLLALKVLLQLIDTVKFKMRLKHLEEIEGLWISIALKQGKVSNLKKQRDEERRKEESVFSQNWGGLRKRPWRLRNDEEVAERFQAEWDVKRKKSERKAVLKGKDDEKRLLRKRKALFLTEQPSKKRRLILLGASNHYLGDAAKQCDDESGRIKKIGNYKVETNDLQECIH
ncbi:putative RNA-directed DNA polymerase [Tanacetum coccineum]